MTPTLSVDPVQLRFTDDPLTAAVNDAGALGAVVSEVEDAENVSVSDGRSAAVPHSFEVNQKLSPPVPSTASDTVLPSNDDTAAASNAMSYRVEIAVAPDKLPSTEPNTPGLVFHVTELSTQLSCAWRTC